MSHYSYASLSVQVTSVKRRLQIGLRSTNLAIQSVFGLAKLENNHARLILRKSLTRQRHDRASKLNANNCNRGQLFRPCWVSHILRDGRVVRKGH